MTTPSAGWWPGPGPGKGTATTPTVRRNLNGSLAALACMAVLVAAMLPLRAHLSVATTALVLVVPVVVGVAVGGFAAGAVSVVAGFLVFDFFFIPPYLTLDVGAGENWTALGVYALVMLPVARVVAGLTVARTQAGQRGLELRRLFELSTRLVEDRPLPELLHLIVTALVDVLHARHVALLLPGGEAGESGGEAGDGGDGGDGLRIAATAGEPLDTVSRERLRPARGQITSLGPGRAAGRRDGEPTRIALVAAGRPIGMLAITGARITEDQREPLLLFANQIALAVERAQLREQAMQARLTREVERLARTFVAAVSHDLRAPLASIKASSSVLADDGLDAVLTDADRRKLAVLVDTQTDRLAALVTNLLDMSRVQAGVLRPRTSVTTAADLVAAAVRDLPEAGSRRIVAELDAGLPPVDVDPVLIARVLANLLGNALRHAPAGTPVTVGARRAGPGAVAVTVADRGPGIPPERRDEIFGMVTRRAADTGAGLGLVIAKTFVQAHGQRIWIEHPAEGGARFCFTLAAAAALPPESQNPENEPWPAS